MHNFRKNCVGTLSFEAKFQGMRKAQEFITFPMKEAVRTILIQSDTRFAWINLDSGAVDIRKGRIGPFARAGALTQAELLLLKAALFDSATPLRGNVVQVENDGALLVLGAIA